MFSIYHLHRDEYGTVLHTTKYGPYPEWRAIALAAEFRDEYGYECIIHNEDTSKHN